MIDLTEKFFKDINNSKEVLYEGYKSRESEPIKLKGRCAVIARKEKKHIEKLEKFIRNAGMKPIILQSEETKTSPQVERKCKNLDLLVFYQPETYYHFASGNENKLKRKLLGDKGIFVSTRWSDENMLTPAKLLDKLFTYIRISDEFKHLHNLDYDKANFDMNDIKFPEDIEKKQEYFEFLKEYEINNNYQIQLINIETKKFHNESIFINSENQEKSLKVISKSELKYNEVNKNFKDINENTRTVMFTFLSQISLSAKQIKEMEIHLDSIFQNYNNFIYSSKVSVFPLI